MMHSHSDARALERLMSRVVMIPMCGCWIFDGAHDGHGYGHIWFRDRVDKAQRVSWVLHCCEIPESQWVLHKCDVRCCVRPDHLFLGDRTANMKDMAAKGRQVFQANPNKIPRGERAGAAILSEDDAVSILDRLTAGESGASLGREFNVSRCTISALKVGRTWSHLPRGEATHDGGSF